MNFRYNRLATASAAPDATVIFYDNYIPSLKDGQYTIKVSQTLGGDNKADIPTNPQADATQSVRVKGPRFLLNSTDVHKVFPANNAVGFFNNILPMIVFNKRSLPWERNLNGQQPNCPWMALFVFSADQLLVPQQQGASQAQADGSQKNPTCSASLPLKNIINGSAGLPANTLGPATTLDADEDPAKTFCNVIDVPAATFLALAPTLEDARFLAHVRKTATDNKEPLDIAHDGWFSNVVANRSGIAPAKGSKQKNIAHLVSLEGFEPYLTASPKIITQQNVRLISLYSWTFDCLAEPNENFSQLMNNLVSPASQQGTKLLLQLPLPATPQTNNAADVQVTARLQHGYVPLSYATWSGEKTFAWYRGPLSPVPVSSFMGDGNANNPLMPMVVSDAMVYDKNTGLFDESYAVAFQTGRSLALASKVFSTNLLQWRRTAHSLVDLMVEYLNSPALRPQFIQQGLIDASGNLTTTGIADIASLLEKDVVPANFTNYLATVFADNIAKEVGKKGGYDVADANMKMQGIETPKAATLSTLQTLMGNPDIATLLVHLSGLDMIGTISTALTTNNSLLTLGLPGATEALNMGAQLRVTSPDGTLSAVVTIAKPISVGDVQITILPYSSQATIPAGSTVQLGGASILSAQILEWLATTALLYNVPFNNLVPDPQLLPQECIRFFYIDENWVDALLDGALSIGIQSSRDGIFHELMRDKLHNAVDNIMGEVRNAIRNAPSNGTLPAAGTKTGFLLRSVAVSAWPGLEIRAWADVERKRLLKPLRLDRVAPDIMFAIFPDIPVAVDIDEPSEGIVFGFEDDGIDLRYVPGVAGNAQIGTLINGKTISNNTINQTKRPSGFAYNIAGNNGLAGVIGKQLNVELSPASFAVQMVCVPEQMQFF